MKIDDEKEYYELFTQALIAADLVDTYFKDINKTVLWLETPNPLLGGQAPFGMIVAGRYDKLMAFIEAQLDGNKPIK